LKAIIKFLLTTGTGKLIIQLLAGWVVKKVREGLKKANERGIPLEDALDIIHGEIHADIHDGKTKDVLL
jgi:hypothetical protein